MAYITVTDLLSEGVTLEDYGNENYLNARIVAAQEFIEQVTGRFFEKRDNYVLRLDGRGHDTLFLPVPPASANSITEVTVSDDVLDSSLYEYPFTKNPDSRYNPILLRIGGTWPSGTLNVKITGSFGFIEEDETTPPLIKDLCKRIVMWNIRPLSETAEANKRDIVEEQLGDYRYRLREKASRGGVFGDGYIDSLLTMYKKVRMAAI